MDSILLRLNGPRKHHEEEGIGLCKQRQEVGSGVLVVQHLHLQLPCMRSRLPAHCRIAHLQPTHPLHEAFARRAMPDSIRAWQRLCVKAQVHARLVEWHVMIQP